MEVTRKQLHTDWLGSAQSLLVTVVIAVFVITFIVQAFQIPSASMEDTLLTGDYLLVDKLRYGGGGDLLDRLMPYRPIRRGDVIVFKYPVNPSEHFVKRVIGVPGDRVRLVNRRVYVNGRPLSEPYVRYTRHLTDAFRDDFPQLSIVPGLEGEWWLQMQKLVDDRQLIVPVGSYFVLGDNRDDSLDSRYWGFVPRENIVGRPLLIYWSVRDAEPEPPASPTPSDKLFHFAYAVTHLFQITRWDRTFRVVH